MPSPDTVAGPHFFYRTPVTEFDPQALQVVVQAAQRTLEEGGLHVAEIDAYSVARMERCYGAPVKPSIDALLRSIGWDNLPFHATASVLVCEWASVHVDDSYAGSAFASFVLHTGPEPYVMQTMHTEVEDQADYDEVEGIAPGRKIRLRTSTRRLSVGDAFVFDPTTPHMAMPAVPNQDALLILLQLELPDGDEQQREQLLKRFPPQDGDQSQENLFGQFGI